MNLTVVLGALSLVASMGVLWWSTAPRPSAARANLFAGMPQVAPAPDASASLLGQVGQAVRRLLPSQLVDGLEVRLVQAGHPNGLDLTRILGLKLSLAALAGFALFVQGHPVIATVAAVLLFFAPDYWVMSERDKRQASLQTDVAAARVTRVAGDAKRAADPARRAMIAFLDLAMPLDAAEARLELAHALASEACDVATDEAQTALAVFRELGAARAVDSASALLRDLAMGTHADRQHRGTSLTPRERQVLELVAQGMSNARIAASLVISEKTAGHHVSHILAKLGVHNRTEAAAHLKNQRAHDVHGQ